MNGSVEISEPVLQPLGTWPLNVVQFYAWRQTRLRRLRTEPDFLVQAIAYYREHPAEFIAHWVDTFDPRLVAKGRPAWVPLWLFPKQLDLVNYLEFCRRNSLGGPVTKSRDMGASWVGMAYSVWLWLFYPGTALTWGSRKAELVDKLGVTDSLLEKARKIIGRLPDVFTPKAYREADHATYMRIINPDNGSTLIGEVGRNQGRGGRSTMYFMDEADHYGRDAESIESAVTDNTQSAIAISSVQGRGTVFERKYEVSIPWTPSLKASDVPLSNPVSLTMAWCDHPDKDVEWLEAREAVARAMGMYHLFASEVLMNRDETSVSTAFNASDIDNAFALYDLLEEHNALTSDQGYALGQDVGDGGDADAYCIRHGIIVVALQDWHEDGGDVGAATRKCVQAYRSIVQQGAGDYYYDGIGVGAGVKAEFKRLRSEGKLGSNLRPRSFVASSKPLQPKAKVIKGERIKNSEMFANRKDQAYWRLARRFEATTRYMNGYEVDLQDCIALPRNDYTLRLRKELLQIEVKDPESSFYRIDKSPDGKKSPNLAECVMIAFHATQPRRLFIH